MSKRLILRHIIMSAIGLLLVAVGACQQGPTSDAPVTSGLSDSAWPNANDSLDPDLVVDAAHRVVSRYLATTDTITRDGGEGSSRMAGLTTPSWLPTEEAAFAHYRTQRLRTIGDTSFDSLVIQSVSESVTGAIHVDAIVCVDARWVWLLPWDAPDPPEGLVEWLRWGDDDVEISDDDFALWSDYLDSVQPVPGEREAIVLWMAGADLGSLVIDGTVNWEGADSCHTSVID
jgi:hypothetical protein